MIIKVKINSQKKYSNSRTETETEKFIWGIKSYDDFSGSVSANLYTMNDIDLVYLKDKHKYAVEVETAFIFEKEENKKKYLKRCLSEFTRFMIENNYRMDIKPSWHEVFSCRTIDNLTFDSIEECYAMFKLLVDGYCGQE